MSFSELILFFESDLNKFLTFLFFSLISIFFASKHTNKKLENLKKIWEEKHGLLIYKTKSPFSFDSKHIDIPSRKPFKNKGRLSNLITSKNNPDLKIFNWTYAHREHITARWIFMFKINRELVPHNLYFVFSPNYKTLLKTKSNALAMDKEFSKKFHLNTANTDSQNKKIVNQIFMNKKFQQILLVFDDINIECNSKEIFYFFDNTGLGYEIVPSLLEKAEYIHKKLVKIALRSKIKTIL